jgi:hypothetical protein
LLLCVPLFIFYVPSANATTYYTYTFHGPFYEDGTAAAANVSCALLYVNSTIYRFYMNSTFGTYSNLTITSTSPAQQIIWNASSALNYTRRYDFLPNITSDTVNLYVPSPLTPAYIYSFSISDFYGMINPYLESSISTDGLTSHAVERWNLNSSGTVTFVMAQSGTYTLTFICNQGTYAQSFTAGSTFTNSLTILAGAIPVANATLGLNVYAEAVRLNETAVGILYTDSSNSTSALNILITHKDGVTSVNDYLYSTPSNALTLIWNDGDVDKDYYINVTSTSNGQVYEWDLIAASNQFVNPMSGLFDWLGKNVRTMPQVSTGWPTQNGITLDPAQLIAAFLIILGLAVGSYFSTGASCVIAWVIAGVMLYLHWWQGSIPMLSLAFFFTILILIDEYKKQTGGTFS